MIENIFLSPHYNENLRKLYFEIIILEKYVVKKERKILDFCLILFYLRIFD